MSRRKPGPAEQAAAELEHLLHAPPGELGFLAVLQADDVKAIHAAVVEARRRQRQALIDANEHALSFIPALLRPVVRRLLQP